jgi:hypothetical protein
MIGIDLPSRVSTLFQYFQVIHSEEQQDGGKPNIAYISAVFLFVYSQH